MTPIDVASFVVSPHIAVASISGLICWLGINFLCAGSFKSLRRRFNNQWPFKGFDNFPLATSIVIPLALLWVVLFFLAIYAAFWAMLQLIGAHPAPMTTGAPISGTPPSGLGALGLGTLLGALLGGPFLIYSTVLKHRTVGFQKEGHLTDRISKAVEQLGAEKTVKRAGSEETLPNIEVRIGGILSLERIAQDSTDYDHGRDHVLCMEILCAYIRENAPASAAEDHSFGEWEPLPYCATDAERAAHLEKRKARFGSHYTDSKVYQWAQNLPEPRADVALALRVLGRRTAKQRQAEARWGKDAGPDAEWVFDLPCPSLPDATDDRATTADELAALQVKLRAWESKLDAYEGYRIDLRKTNLQRADLSDLIFSGAKLQGARLDGANLRQTRLKGANLRQTRLEAADLWQARLEGATLLQARMEGARLQKARMEGAGLAEAWLEGASLGEARMAGATFSWARMEGAKLWAARMEGANLINAQMEGTNLRWARLQGADLDGACLVGAALREMDCSGVELSPDQINSTFGDASVTLPNGVTPDSPDWPAHWPTFALDDGAFNTQWRKWQASPDT
jgi:uncharacterized protein YjbI with pentapeptide repeats